MFLKKGIETALLLWAVTVFISCSSNGELTEDITTVVERQTELNIDLVAEQTQEESVNEMTWQAFKTAIMLKNEDLLKARCTEKITDYEALLYMLNELYVMRKLDESVFDDLEYIELEGKEYLKFYAEDIGEDEFGYEYATAITLYFVATDEGLFLDRYSAAG
jgi:hypothetical protein